MNLSDSDLQDYTARAKARLERHGKAFDVLIIPSNVELTDTQRAWIKRNAPGVTVERNGKVVQL